MKELAKENLYQIRQLVANISIAEYTTSNSILSGATIGQHVRHILEFYQTFLKGLKKNEICYDDRKRDLKTEINPGYALKLIDNILIQMDTIEMDKTLQLKACYRNENTVLINTSVYRELAYCVEHSIHHQAIIKTGLMLHNIQDIIDEDFGIAHSTLNFRNRNVYSNLYSER